jgi:hypothetical protein
MFDKTLNGREVEESGTVFLPIFVVLAQSATAPLPGQGAFDDPAPGFDGESHLPRGFAHDLDRAGEMLLDPVDE